MSDHKLHKKYEIGNAEFYDWFLMSWATIKCLGQYLDVNFSEKHEVCLWITLESIKY